MKVNRVLAGTLVLVLAGLGNGCVENDKSLVIVYNVVPDISDCTIKVQTDADALYYPFGTFDVAAGVKANNVYLLTPQVENFMPNNINTEEKDVDAMTVQLKEAKITYVWQVGRDIIASYPELMALEGSDPFISPVAGTVPAADTSGTAGKITTWVKLFSTDVTNLLGEVNVADLPDITLGVRVVLHGETLGGSPIRSAEFKYPLTFCSGCTLDQYCCPNTTSAKPMEFCIKGQDSAKPCSSC